MNNRLALALAVGGGYVLGRTKKGKLAIGLGSMALGKRLNLSPQAVARLASEQLQKNPQFKEIGDQLRGDLRGVGKAATGAVVSRRLNSLADSLHQRTLNVQDQLSGAASGGLEDDRDDRDDSDDEERYDEDRGGREDREDRDRAEDREDRDRAEDREDRDRAEGRGRASGDQDGEDSGESEADRGGRTADARKPAKKAAVKRPSTGAEKAPAKKRTVARKTSSAGSAVHGAVSRAARSRPKGGQDRD
jgi:hypothetical protein